MAKTRSLSSILEAAAQPEDVADRIKILHDNDSPSLRQLLFLMWGPTKFLLPEGKPPYTPYTAEQVPYRLYNEMKRLYLFLEGGHPTLAQNKREQLFIELLESIDPSDAELLIAIKDKKTPWKKLARNVVMKAFPDLIPDEQK